MNTIHKAVAGLALAVSLTACSASLETDQRGLEYNGGPSQGHEFTNCVDPGTRALHGPGDSIVTLPAGQRTYDFTGKRDPEGHLIGESEPISVTDKNGVTLAVPGIATFSLNDSCAPIKRGGKTFKGGMLQLFWEEIGHKYGANHSDGWRNSLNAYMGNPLDKAMDQASQEYTWQQMLNDQQVRSAWEQRVGVLAQRYVKQQAGEDFYCSPTYTGRGSCGAFRMTIQKPHVPGPISDALAQTAAEAELTKKAAAANARVNQEALALKRLTDILGPDAAVLYQLAKEGKIDYLPVPAGGNVNVNPR